MQKDSRPYKLIHPEGAPRNLRIRVPIDEPEEAEENQPETIQPPAWLAADAKAIFEARCTEIREAGYWQPRFVDCLGLFASLMAEYQRAPAKSSAAKVTQMRLLLSELKLTPASSRGVECRLDR